MSLAKYQIIFALILVVYSSNSNDVKDIQLPKLAIYNHILISNNDEGPFVTNFYPIEIITTNHKDKSKSTLFDAGKTRSNDNNDKCDLCLPGHKKKLTKDGNFICSKCKMNNLYLPDKIDANEKSCRTTDCSIEEYFDLEKGECIKCSKHLKNSIGRRPGTLPLIEYCSCSENDLKMNYSSSFECISFGKLGDAKNDIIHSFEQNYRQVIIHFSQKSSDVSVTFYHCHPKIRLFSQERSCLCDEGFQFFDGVCKSCLISSNNNTYENLECTMCSKNEIISNDRTRCLCKNGYFRETMNYSKCKKCPIFFTTDRLESISPKSCSKFNAGLDFYFSILFIILLISVVTCIVLISNRNKKNKRNNNANDYAIIVYE